MNNCTLVIVPGLGASPKAWYTISNYVSTFCNVAVIDNGDKGLSRNCFADISIELMAEQLIADVVNLENNGPLIVLGHSMGALISIAACSINPDIFSSAILVSPPVKNNYYLRKTLLTFTRLHQQLKATDFVSLAMLQNMNPLFVNANEDLIDSLTGNAEDSLNISNKLYVNQVKAILHFEIQKYLPHLKIPLRIIAGSCDNLANQADIRSCFENIPNTQVLIIDKVGHAVATEVQAFFMDLLVGYMMRYVVL